MILDSDIAKCYEVENLRSQFVTSSLNKNTYGGRSGWVIILINDSEILNVQTTSSASNSVTYSVQQGDKLKIIGYGAGNANKTNLTINLSFE